MRVSRTPLVELGFACVVFFGSGCAGTHESAMHADLRSASRSLAPPSENGSSSHPLGPRLDDYLAYAAQRSPELRASFERWRASVHRISRARRLPEPMLEFGVFVWNSGDNAGLRPARVGLRQEFPWPTKLSAGSDAASAEARARQRRLQALMLELRERVVEAYYRLWLLRQERAVEQEQLQVLRGLSESALGQVATGAANLADQQQIDLAVARRADAISALEEQERSAEAQLRALIGVSHPVQTPTLTEPPSLARPGETEPELQQAVLDHPFIESFALMGEAAEAMARAESAERLPGFSLGVEWARMPGPMGESAIMPSVGIRLPLWQGSTREGVRAAEADAAAERADGRAAVQRAHAELSEALARVRDSLRRVEVNENTLHPMAEAALASALGALATGRATVASSLSTQRELLEIRIDVERARAEHAIAWARLERVVGRSVERRSVVREKTP